VARSGALKNKKTTSVAKLFIDEVVSRHGAVKVLLRWRIYVGFGKGYLRISEDV
jgi:hypothetical protein